jgi:hypothetical protein
MAWLEEKYDGKTTLAWWQVCIESKKLPIFCTVSFFSWCVIMQESFKMAAANLFSAVDSCAIQDVQVFLGCAYDVHVSMTCLNDTWKITCLHVFSDECFLPDADWWSCYVFGFCSP